MSGKMYHLYDKISNFLNTTSFSNKSPVSKESRKQIYTNISLIREIESKGLLKS